MLRALRSTARFISRHPLTRDQKIRAFLRVVHWQVASRLHDPVIFPWVGGTRLALCRGMAGATGNVYVGLHEFSDMAFTLHFLRPGDLFIDGGANVGTYTVLASGVKGAQTIAFEPDPETAAGLRRNVALNHLEELVAVREAALGAALGQIELTIGRGPENRIAPEGKAPRRLVRLETLDGALEGRSPTMMKLDVEGYEHEVLGGAAATLASPELKAVISEDQSAAVTGCLREAGFAPFVYDPFTRRLDSGAKPPNVLFLRDLDWIRSRVAEAPAVEVLGRRL